MSLDKIIDRIEKNGVIDDKHQLLEYLKELKAYKESLALKKEYYTGYEDGYKTALDEVLEKHKQVVEEYTKDPYLTAYLEDVLDITTRKFRGGGKMLNKEKYANEIVEIALGGYILALKDGKPIRCAEVECGECRFNEDIRKTCYYNRIDWANSEYVETEKDAFQKGYEEGLAKGIDSGFKEGKYQMLLKFEDFLKEFRGE